MQFLAARSQWTNLISVKCSIPFAIPRQNPNSSARFTSWNLLSVASEHGQYITLRLLSCRSFKIRMPMCCTLIVWFLKNVFRSPLLINGIKAHGFSSWIEIPIRDRTLGWLKFFIIKASSRNSCIIWASNSSSTVLRKRNSKYLILRSKQNGQWILVINLDGQISTVPRLMHEFSLNDSLNSLNSVTENISHYGKRIQTCHLLC